MSYLLGCGGDGAAPGPEGIERPLQEAAATLEGVVARVDVGHDRPAQSSGHLLQEGARATRRLRPRPVRSAQKQVIPRTGHGDVREPTLLLPLARAPGRDEVVQRTGEVLLRRGLVSTPAKGGEPVGIAAELVRKNAEPEPSACVFGPGRQLILDQSDDGHGIPFEALRSMDREQLHDIVLRRLGARRELIETLGMVEPGEKAGQRPALVGRQKAVQLVDEGAQLVTGHPRRTACLVRGQLDIQPEFELDHPHELGNRQCRVPTQTGEDGRRLAEAFSCRRGEVAQPAVVGAVTEEEVESVDERALIIPRRRPHPRDDVGMQRLEGAVVTADPPGQLTQRPQICHADPPARTGEQPDQRRPRTRVADDPERRDDIDHLRRGQQPAEAEDTMRDAAPAQGIGEMHHVLLAAKEHGPRRRGARSRALMPYAREPVRHRIGLRVDVGVDVDLHLARARTRTRPQAFDGDRNALGEGRQHGVGRTQHVDTVAPARHQSEGLGRTGGAECRREVAEVAGAGPSPAVDGLMGVADRHHRRVAEGGGEQLGLHDGRVLVFVQQHDAITVPQLLADRRVRIDDVAGSGHLVGEVDHAVAELSPGVLPRQVGEEVECAHGDVRFRDIGVHGDAGRRRGAFQDV